MNNTFIMNPVMKPNLEDVMRNDKVMYFPRFKKTDGPGKVAIDFNKITLTDGDQDEDWYVTRNFGAGYLTDFTHWVDVNVTKIKNQATCRCYPWALTNADDTLNNIHLVLGSNALIVAARHSLGIMHYKVTIDEIDGGVWITVDTSCNIAVGTPSYLAMSRTGTTGTVEIYSTPALRAAGGAGDVDTLLGVWLNTAFQYLNGLNCYNDGGANRDITATVSNLIIKGRD